MKKAIIISGSIILAVLAVFFSLYFISITPKDTGKFSVDEFVEYIQNPHFRQTKIMVKLLTTNQLPKRERQQLPSALKTPKAAFLNGWVVVFI